MKKAVNQMVVFPNTVIKTTKAVGKASQVPVRISVPAGTNLDYAFSVFRKAIKGKAVSGIYIISDISGNPIFSSTETNLIDPVGTGKDTISGANDGTEPLDKPTVWVAHNLDGI